MLQDFDEWCTTHTIIRTWLTNKIFPYNSLDGSIIRSQPTWPTTHDTINPLADESPKGEYWLSTLSGDEMEKTPAHQKTSGLLVNSQFLPRSKNSLSVESLHQAFGNNKNLVVLASAMSTAEVHSVFTRALNRNIFFLHRFIEPFQLCAILVSGKISWNILPSQASPVCGTFETHKKKIRNGLQKLFPIRSPEQIIFPLDSYSEPGWLVDGGIDIVAGRPADVEFIFRSTFFPFPRTTGPGERKGKYTMERTILLKIKPNGREIRKNDMR